MSAEPAEAPRWLNAGELDSWLPVGGLLLKLPAALDAQMQRDSGLSHFEYLVLASLSEAPERTRRMSALAALANGSLSRLSHVVKRLEARGWIERRAVPVGRPLHQRGAHRGGLGEGRRERARSRRGRPDADPGRPVRRRARQFGDMARRILDGLEPGDARTVFPG